MREIEKRREALYELMGKVVGLKVDSLQDFKGRLKLKIKETEKVRNMSQYRTILPLITIFLSDVKTFSGYMSSLNIKSLDDAFLSEASNYLYLYHRLEELDKVIDKVQEQITRIDSLPN